MISNNDYIKTFVKNLNEKEKNNLYILVKNSLDFEFDQEYLADVLQIIINKLDSSNISSNYESILENINLSVCGRNIFNYKESHSFPSTTLNKLFLTLKSQNEINTFCCPCCGQQGNSIVKNGLSKLGKQRFKCRACNKIFSSATKSTLWYSKKPLLIWLRYIKCMINGLTIIESAKTCKIAKNTSFYWRHKILNAINVVTFSNLSGIIEIAENKIKKCNKGNHSKKHRLELAKYNNEKNSMVSFTVCRDRKLNILTSTLSLGNPTYEIIDNTFSNKFLNNSILYCQNKPLYFDFAKNHNFKFKAITNKSINVNKNYHIKNAIKFSTNVKSLDSGLFRVSTKYLCNYSSWITMYEYSKSLNFFKRVVGWLMLIIQNNKGIRIKDFKLFKNPIAT